jgi:ubiquinone/menaquinone biosynthesis C-methylase UbiE
MSMLGKWGSRAKESVLAMRYSGLSDKKWFETIAASLSDASLGLPGFPSPQVQANFTGRSGRPALEEAFEFYTLIKSSVPTLTGPILDFGCGWGRILRFFLKDLDPKYVHGVDVEPSAIAECRDTKVPGDIQLIAPHGPLPFSKDTFQIVYAYSVFTHLPEQAAAHWMREIKRVLKPEGRIVFTALTARYLRLCIEYQDFPPSTWQRQMANGFPNPEHLLAMYEKGKFIYTTGSRRGSAKPTGGVSVLTSDVFGWAAVSPNIMRDVWGLRLEQTHDDGLRFLQGAFIASCL